MASWWKETFTSWIVTDFPPHYHDDEYGSIACNGYLALSRHTVSPWPHTHSSISIMLHTREKGNYVINHTDSLAKTPEETPYATFSTPWAGNPSCSLPGLIPPDMLPPLVSIPHQNPKTPQELQDLRVRAELEGSEAANSETAFQENCGLRLLTKAGNRRM